MAALEMLMRLAAVGGLATCTVCSRLVAWKVPVGELDGLDEHRCPVCTGTLIFELDEGSLVLDVVFEPINGGG